MGILLNHIGIHNQGVLHQVPTLKQKRRSLLANNLRSVLPGERRAEKNEWNATAGDQELPDLRNLQQRCRRSSSGAKFWCRGGETAGCGSCDPRSAASFCDRL